MRPDQPANLPHPEILSLATAATWLTGACRNTWGHFVTFCASTARQRRNQEFVAAKLMGRWRSGAPLTLAPEKDDPALGADMQRNNNFNYKEMDPHGYAVPLELALPPH